MTCRRIAQLISLVVGVVAALMVFETIWGTPAWATVSYSQQEIALVGLLNDYRESNGLEPLLVSDRLSEAGDRHSSDMGKYSFFSHYTVQSDWFLPGASPWDRMAASGYDFSTSKGENIAAGQPTAASVFSAWKASAGHNANMLSTKFQVVGVSLVFVSGSEYGYYWSTEFGGYVDSSAHTLQSASTTTTTVSLPTTTTTMRSSTTTTTSLTSTTGGSTSTTVNQRPAVFLDVDGQTPYAAQIGLLASCGIVTGYPDGSFGPNDPVLRQQVAKMIALSMKWDVATAPACPFADVQTQAVISADPLYPAAYIAACAAHGVVSGESARMFGPYHQVTRAQLVTMVARALNLPSPPPDYLPPFGNFDVNHYPWARRAAFAGLLDGLEGISSGFDFWAPATRAEVCLLVSSLVGR